MESETNGVERNVNGTFTAGNKAAAGRGSTKISGKVRESLMNFLELNIDAVQESFDKLKPLEKLQFVANILPYVVPKMSSIQSENNHRLSGGINIRWSEPGVHNPLNKGSNGELLGIQSRLQNNSESGGNQVGEDLHD